MANGQHVSLDFRKFIDERCDEAQERLTGLAEACLADGAGAMELRQFNSTMDDVFLRGADDLQALFPSDNAPIKLHYQKRIKAFLDASVFWRRVFEKPRGYAGDYLMMDMVYRCEPLPEKGTHRFSDLLDAWFLSTPTSQATRNRHAYLVGNLGRYRAEGAKKIASLAAGPCREVRSFLDHDAPHRHSHEFVFIDFDDEALSYAHALLAKHLNSKTKSHFVNENVLNVILGRRVPELENCDVIYSTGFADYLSDRLLTRLVEAVYRMLAPGGYFLLGQFVDLDEHPDRSGLQWVTDWNLIYRTPTSLRNIFSNTSFGPNIRIETEPKGIIMFAEVRKT